MFREMARKNQQLSQEECLRILSEEPRGVLSLLGDDGYPYGVPTNFWLCPEDGYLYFHSGKTGHKVDALRRCDKASLCVFGSGLRNENDWALTFRSVIVFGRIEVLEDQARAMEITRSLSLQFTQDTSYIENEIAVSGHKTLCFRLVPEHITGKKLREA